MFVLICCTCAIFLVFCKSVRSRPSPGSPGTRRSWAWWRRHTSTLCCIAWLREEQVHLPMVQGEPQAPPPLSQDPQEECQLEVKSFFFLHAQKDEKNYYYLLQLWLFLHWQFQVLCLERPWCLHLIFDFLLYFDLWWYCIKFWNVVLYKQFSVCLLLMTCRI